jgi:hypothetical protein
MTCFPYVRPTEQHALESVTAAIGDMTKRPERALASQAVLCIKSFFELDPSKYLVPALYCYIDILATLDTRKTDQIKHTLSNFAYLIKCTGELMANDPSLAASVKPSTWQALRQHLEGATLVWLCHDEPDLRFKAAVCLAGFSAPHFRALEGPLQQCLFLADALLPDANLNVVCERDFVKNLCCVAKDRYDDFSGVISKAWVRMYADVEEVMMLGLEKGKGKAQEGSKGRELQGGGTVLSACSLLFALCHSLLSALSSLRSGAWWLLSAAHYALCSLLYAVTIHRQTCT